ncbi:MAG: hypothetical protein PHI59_10310 [Candidatus Omnitrophica bacterium]|nr:hypothetical protein [Candidatus Omnitrophota bacterium]
MNIINSIDKLDKWIEKNGWAGYDPYDIKGHPLFTKRCPSYFERVIRKQSYRAEPFAPIFLRKIFNVKKAINAKAMGLFAESYIRLYRALKKDSYLIKAQQCLEWLGNNFSKRYSGMCWGYPFDWQSDVFFPKGTPSSVVTAIVGNAYWSYYEFSQDRKYLDICKSICDFFINDLKIDKISDNKICFSYTPMDNFHVNNANLLVAEFLIRMGKETGNKRCLDYGIKAVNYTLGEQNADGSILYWGKDQKSHNHIDHYHAGFKIRSLYSIWKLTKNEEIYKALKKYYKFYRDNFFVDRTIPKITPKSVYPINIHSCAEAILCVSALIEDFPEGKDFLDNSLRWTIENMQTKEGWFIYSIMDINGLKFKVRIPYIRWGQAWMLSALSRAYNERNV